MCGNLLLPRASPLRSHLRGTGFGSAVAQGLFLPVPLRPSPLDSCLRRNDEWLARGTTRVWSVPHGLGIPSGLLWFRRSQHYLSASEPYSYNGLRNRVVAAFRPSPFIGTEDVFQWLVAGHRRRVVCWRPLLPRPLPYFIQLFLLRLKRLCARPLSTRRFFVSEASRLTPLGC